VEQRSVARAVEVAEGLADKGNRESSPASRVFRSHLQDRHEHRRLGTSVSLRGRGAAVEVELELELLLVPPRASGSRLSFSVKRSLKSAIAAVSFCRFRERLSSLLSC